MHRLAVTGRVFFAIALAGWGALQLVNGSFVRLVPLSPVWVKWQPTLAPLTGAVLVVLAAALFHKRLGRIAAMATAVVLLLVLLVFQLPVALSDPLTGFMWTNPAKVLALFGGAILLAGEGDGADARPDLLSRLVPAARVMPALFLLICGIQHFDYAAFVDTLVPAWIPPGARFWTCFSGTALLAGGAGLLIPRVARLAALLSALMIFLWVVLLHIPRVATETAKAFELAGVFEALAMSGVALLVADSLSRKPAAGKASV